MGTSILLVIGISFAIVVISFAVGALVLAKTNKSGISNQDKLTRVYEEKAKRRPLWKWY